MSLRGKYAICVGATAGIGRGVAIKLAQMEANVTVVGRNAAAGEEVLSELFKVHPKGDHSVVLVDASSMKSIEKGSAEYLAKNHGKPLHFLVQSQGMATMAGRTETSEGIDQKMALHYYGRVLFNRQLAPRMKETALLSENNDVRSLSIFSGGVHSSFKDLDDLDLKKNYTLSNAANAPGFYNDLVIDQMSRDNAYLGTVVADAKRGISYTHAAPGAVNTSWGKDFPWFLVGPLRLLQKVIAKSPEECAKLMIDNALVAPLRQGQGFHVMSETGGVAKVTDLHNDRYREAVWKHTNELIDQALAK